MPITFHFRPEAKLIICEHAGKVPDDEFTMRYKSIFEENMFTPGMNLLIDLRQTDSSPRSREGLRRFADFAKSKFAGTGTRPKIAVVAPTDLSFGLARMYEAFADSIPWDFVVYRAVDTALAWLRAPQDLMDNLDKKA